VAVGRAAVRRTAVLTKFGHRPPEVGVPAQNPNLDEPGLVVTDFVDRVGDPVGLLASDGSSHRADALLADGLRAMLHTVARQQPEPVGVSYPAHWRAPAVDTLRGALSTMSEFRTPHPVLLASDAVAALTALQREPGVPARGVIALCDFGGTGTSITLADAARDFAPIAPTERHVELSGDLIDQALLTHVIGGLGSAGSVDLTGTSAIGSLSRLRAQCRMAKERLSTAAVTALAADLPGHSGEIRLTRSELDDAVRQPLAGLLEELQDLLRRSGVRPTDLVAVASVGGGARMPIVTTTLSESLRVPVITTAHPELAAAIGAGVRAVRGTVAEGATTMAPVAPVVPAAEPNLAPGPVGGLAWSDAGDDIPDVVAPVDDDPAAEAWSGDSARPQIEFAAPEEPEDEPAPWYRSPFVMMAGALAVVLAVVVAAAVFLTGGDEPAITTPTTTPTTATTPTATSPAPTELPAAPPPSEPAIVNPPPSTITVTEEGPPPPAPPPAPTEPPAPPPSEPPPPPPPPPPPAEPPPPSSPPPLIPTLPYETIPGLPFVPAPPGLPPP
jgi:hypothetical protein